MRLLVLGGTRFIGLHLVHALVQQGHSVTVLNRGQTPADLPPEVQRLYADRTQADQVRSALQGHDFDAVYDVNGYAPADVQLMVDLLRDRIGHYTFVSSCAVFRRSEIQPIDETFARDASESNTPYGRNKVACERLLLDAFHGFGFPATVAHSSWVYGPGNHATDQEAKFFTRLRLGRPILIPDRGIALWHGSHVADTVQGLSRVLGNPRALGQSYIITGPQAITHLGYVRTLAKVVGVEPRLVFVPAQRLASLSRPIFPFGWEFSRMYRIEKAIQELDYRPQYGVEFGLRDTYAWWLEHGQKEFDFTYEEDLADQLREVVAG